MSLIQMSGCTTVKAFWFCDLGREPETNGVHKSHPDEDWHTGRFLF